MDNQKWLLVYDIPSNLNVILSYVIAAIGLSLSLSLLYYYARKKQYSLAKNIELAKLEAQMIANTTRQVGHDILSPLSAIKLISTRNDLDPKIKSLLIRATERTEAIIEEMKTGTIASPTRVSVKERISEIIAEKIILYPQVNFHFQCPSRIMLNINSMEFMRIASNLLDNAAQSESHNVSVQVTLVDNCVDIMFQDDGRGIPPEIKGKLGTRGFTFGKKNGSGLGLFHAMNCLKSWGGNLKIENRPDGATGTSAHVSIPYRNYLQ